MSDGTWRADVCHKINSVLHTDDIRVKRESASIGERSGYASATEQKQDYHPVRERSEYDLVEEKLAG